MSLFSKKVECSFNTLKIVEMIMDFRRNPLALPLALVASKLPVTSEVHVVFVKLSKLNQTKFG